MTGDESEALLRLKNGARVEARLGRANYRSLCTLLEREPELFRSLHAIADARVAEVSEQHVIRLKDIFYLRPDGTISPDVRDVLLAAYRETPDGPALVNPFQFISAEEVRQEEQAEGDSWKRLRKWLREDEDNPGTGGHRGP